jgi:histidinol-phosphate/aromatic aminotransferase/cobyric acid decarboxylase-like protein
MEVACSTHGTEENCIRISVGNPEERRPFGIMWIMLKRVLNK